MTLSTAFSIELVGPALAGGRGGERHAAAQQARAPRAPRAPQAARVQRAARQVDRQAARNNRAAVRNVRVDNRQAANAAQRAQKNSRDDQNRRALTRAAANNRRATHDLSKAQRKNIQQAARIDNRAINRADKNARKAARYNYWKPTVPIRYNRPSNRWDAKLDNRARYQAYRKYNSNWSAQKAYLSANLNRFNQLAAINQVQQQQLDAQMRTAYLAYHNNNWNGPYNWSGYSNPQFLDYLQTRQPSLLQRVLSSLGLGANDNYLYSPDWNIERAQLSSNFVNIPQLAVSGQISPQQVAALQGQLEPQFMAYKNNQWNGGTSWGNYSDPGFVDYLNTRQPGILATIRDYLIR